MAEEDKYEKQVRIFLKDVKEFNNQVNNT